MVNSYRVELAKSRMEKKEDMRTVTKIASTIMAIGILVTLMLPRGYATVYQASDFDDWAYPPCSASFAVDDIAHKFSLTWSSAGYLLFPAPSIFLCGTWKIWDDLGYSHESNKAKPSGAETFEDYYNRGTWAHGEVKWTFLFPVPEGIGMYVATAWVRFYVGESTGGFCPTLFVWNGTDYSEEGILNIHAELDITVQHEIQNSLALENGVYKLQLRELDNFTSHIDQVKLLALNRNGETKECRLIGAKHSADGNVLYELLKSDDVRTDTEPYEYIDLTFLAPTEETDHFIFVIEGYNMKVP